MSGNTAKRTSHVGAVDGDAMPGGERVQPREHCKEKCIAAAVAWTVSKLLGAEGVALQLREEEPADEPLHAL